MDGGPLFGCARRSPVRGASCPRVRGESPAPPPYRRVEHGRGVADDEKVSTPVGDQPTRDGAGGRDVSGGVPGRTRRSRDGDPSGAEPVTVEQLLARQGS